MSRLAAWALLASAAAGAAFGVDAPLANGGLSAPARTVRLAIEPAPPGRLPWVVFDERSGLPQHTIVDLLTDQQGFVWAATQDGPARFNGRAWEAVPLPRRMGSNYPRAMRTARDGGLWIGSFDGGVAHLRDGVWTITDAAAGLPSNRVRGLLEVETANGGTALWIATENGVARLEAGRLTVYGEGSGLPSLDTEALAETTDERGARTLLVGTSQGLARFDGERFVPLPVPRQILGHRIGDIVECTGLGGGRALWITSYGAGLAVREGEEWTVLDTTSGLPSNVEVLTRSAADDGTPALWIGTEGGLLRYEHRRAEAARFTLFDERCGLPIRIIWKVLETVAADGQRTLWLGTWGGGVVRLSPHVWTAFDATTGLPSGSVTSILVTHKVDAGTSTPANGRRAGATAEETLWAGTSDGELARFDGRRFVAVPLPEPLRHTIIFSLLETEDDDGGATLWVSGFGGGVGRLKNGRWSLLDPKLLPNQRVYKVVETRADDGTRTLWFSTEGGIARLERGVWTTFRKELPSAIVVEVLETVGADRARTLWAATSRGVARLHGGTWSVLGKESGLISENILSLAETTDADGRRWLWASTLGGGASRLPLEPAGERAARWESFTTTSTPALPSDTVMSIAEDRLHRVYLNTTRGILRLTPHKPGVADGAFSAELFTTDDGLPSGDSQQTARFVDRDGRVWVGTARGLAMLDPRRERIDRAPKPLVIESAALSDRSRALRGGESLAYSERNLTFVSALLAWSGESRIRYRYQLAGYDPRPTEWTASPVKEYTNLGAGTYELRVWGMDARGNVSGPRSLPFKVRPAPWLTAWAFALYTFALLCAIHVGTQWRFRHLARRTRELERVVGERTSDLVAARDQLAQLAAVDGLTGIANRRTFDRTLEQAWNHAQRGGHWITLVLLDVDFFKRYNDRYGHARGDACLQAVAGALAAQGRRPTDLVARYGGEEFALVLPDLDPAGARTLLGAVLAAVDGLAIEHSDSTAAPHVTVSLGAVSLLPGAGDDRLAALERADRLLYDSKSAGRHQATLAHPQGTERVTSPLNS